MRVRSPWTICSVLLVAASRHRDQNVKIREAREHSYEEAQGIARSSLFGPTVRFEACCAMGIASVWGANAFLPTGHALRMAQVSSSHLPSATPTTEY